MEPFPDENTRSACVSLKNLIGTLWVLYFRTPTEMNFSMNVASSSVNPKPLCS